MLSNTCNRLFHKTILVNAYQQIFLVLSDPVSVSVNTGPHMQLIGNNKFGVDSNWRIGGLFDLKYLAAILKKNSKYM